MEWQQQKLRSTNNVLGRIFGERTAMFSPSTKTPIPTHLEFFEGKCHIHSARKIWSNGQQIVCHCFSRPYFRLIYYFRRINVVIFSVQQMQTMPTLIAFLVSILLYSFLSCRWAWNGFRSVATTLSEITHNRTSISISSTYTNHVKICIRQCKQLEARREHRSDVSGLLFAISYAHFFIRCTTINNLKLITVSTTTTRIIKKFQWITDDLLYLRRPGSSPLTSNSAFTFVQPNVHISK